MPTGDAVPNAPPTHQPPPPPEGHPSDACAEGPPAATTPARARTMTSKSAAIAARSNYVSPYRQAPSRSLSSPVAVARSASASGAAAANAGSPNFKDIVNRFNTKQDEKVPNPRNVISAVAANNARSRRQPVAKPAGERRAAASKSSAAVGRTRQTGRSDSACSSNSSIKSGPTGRQSRSRTTDENDHRRHLGNDLPLLQTNFGSDARKKEHRRSLSALDVPSPSAASLADNELDSRTSTPILLAHRRSRSNLELSTSNSPVRHEQTRSNSRDTRAEDSPRSPPIGRSGIPVSRSGAKHSLHSPDGSAPRTSTQSAKQGVNTQALTSPHGSRRPSQLSKSPNLSAYITAPLPKKSPPLRSSRQRLPAAASTTTHASRQRLQGTGSPVVKDPRQRNNAAFLQESKKHPKRKIPELGTVDFAARRAKIQSAFTKSLKETDEKRPARSPSSRREESDSRRPSEDTEYVVLEDDHPAVDTSPRDEFRGHQGIVQLSNGSGTVGVSYPAEIPDEEEESPQESPAEGAKAEALPEIQDRSGQDRGLGYSLNMPGGLPVSPIERDHSMDEDEFLSANGSPPASTPSSPSPSPRSEEQSSIEQSSVDHDSPPPFALDDRSPGEPSNVLRPSGGGQEQSVDGGNTGIPISVVITPESPRQPTILDQVSGALRASPIEWTDSEVSDSSPVVSRKDFVGSGGIPPVRFTMADGPDMETIPEHDVTRRSLDAGGLSPMIGTAVSDDRATITSFFNRYDEPREDFLDSYQNSPHDDEELQGQREDEHLSDHAQEDRRGHDDGELQEHREDEQLSDHDLEDRRGHDDEELQGHRVDEQLSDHDLEDRRGHDDEELQGHRMDKHLSDHNPEDRQYHDDEELQEHREDERLSDHDHEDRRGHDDNHEHFNEQEWDDHSVEGFEDEEYDSAFHPDRYVRDLSRKPLRLEITDDRRPSPRSDVSPSADDWVTEAETTGVEPSPMFAEHPARVEPTTERAEPKQRPDSPSTPRVTNIELESPLPPTPPPKDSPPRPPHKDKIKKSSSASPLDPSPSTPLSAKSYLPEIETDSEPLGLAIQALPSHYDFRPGDRPSSYHTEQYYSVPRPSIDQTYSYDSARPSIEQHSSRTSAETHSRVSVEQYTRPSADRYRGPEQYAPYRPSLDTVSTMERYSPSSSFYSEPDSRPNSLFTTPAGSQRASETTVGSLPLARPTLSTAEAEEKRQKNLVKRRMIMMEMLDTESSFFRDMTVAAEIYQGSANACSALHSEDVKTIFGNTDAVVAFSRGFQDIIKHAVSAVYVTAGRNGGDKSTAASAANSVNSNDPEGTEDLTEEERDARTYVGEAFAETMYRMEKVYGDYCKNHDCAAQRLQVLNKHRGVQIWLEECRTCADDLTNAWNLESLLIKPVQRILKYPLLLTQLLACTPKDHPDFNNLAMAAKEMSFVAGRLNDMKKRKDIVEKIVQKNKGYDLGHGMTKIFSRRAEKLRQSVGLSENVVDEKYNRLYENYTMHFVQIQVIARDIELYESEIQGHVEKFVEYAKAFRDFGDVMPTQFPEIELKMRQYSESMTEVCATYLVDHRDRVRKHCIVPLTHLLHMHTRPQMIMTKRNTKAVDYARFQAVKAKGDVPDKKVTELADQYIALNETLIEELPRLFILTKKLVDAVLMNFIDLQAQWMNEWMGKLRMSFMDIRIPDRFEDVLRGFVGDFEYNEQVLRQLNICNMNPPMPPASRSQSQSQFDSLRATDATNASRPRTADPMSPSVRERAMSLTNHSPNEAADKNERRHSGGATLSPLVPHGAFPLPALLSPSNRIRANTAVAGPSSNVPPPNRRAYSTNLPESHAAAQASYFGQPTPRPAMSRAQVTAASLPPLVARAPEPNEPSPPPSAAFSSAMPMEDDRAKDQSESRVPSRSNSRTPSRASSRRFNAPLTVGNSGGSDNAAMFVAASLYEFNIDKQRREAGFPYLTYVQGEVFDVIGIKGEIWLARNQDDSRGEIGWIWCKHFTRLDL